MFEETAVVKVWPLKEQAGRVDVVVASWSKYE